MGLFDRLFGKRAVKRDAIGAGWGFSGVSAPSLTGINVNQRTAMTAVAVMSCVSAVSEDVANLTPQIYARQKDGSKRPATDHYLYRLLAEPTGPLANGGWMTWGEWCQMQISALMLRGNAYAIIVRDGRGRPMRLVPVNPDQVALFEGPDGRLFWQVTRVGQHMLDVLRGQPLLIPYEDVLHWKGLTQYGLMGLSKIALNREAIALSIGQEQLAARAMGNGAKQSGVLETDGKLSEEAAKRLKEDWKAINSGLANSGGTAVLEQGLKFKPLSLNMVDLEFIASRNFQIADISRIWRVPLHMLNAEQGKGSSQNITQKSQEYLNFTLRTYIRIIQTRFAFHFDLGPDYFVELDVSELIKADISARYEAYRLALQSFQTVNEVRLLEGLSPIDDPSANTVFRPVNMAPLNSDVFQGIDVDPTPGAGLGSEVGGDNPGAGNPGNGPPNADQDPKP